MYKKCVFAGSFDPITNGHMDIIGKCAMMFEEVVVVVAVNFDKKYYFSKEARVKMVEAACRKYDTVTVKSFDGMMVDFLKAEGNPYYVRGIRDEKDIEYENKAFEFNSKLCPDIQVVYLNCGKENSKVSSTRVRELFEKGENVAKYIPYEILPVLEEYKK